MIWLILLFTITTCEDVKLVKNTDPFNKITTVKGGAPIINLEPVDNSPFHDLIVHPDFELHLYRINENVSIVIEQTRLHVRSYTGQEVFKTILGSNSKLQLLFDNDEVIKFKYSGRRIEAKEKFLGASPQSNAFEKRYFSISGHFRLSQNHITLLKNNRVKLLRVEFENSTTDRQFNSDNEDYFINYLKCLEL